MTKPIIVVKMSCDLLYIIQVKGFLIKSFTFLALLDIKAFGHLSLVTMLLLIGLALFGQAVLYRISITYVAVWFITTYIWIAKALLW